MADPLLADDLYFREKRWMDEFTFRRCSEEHLRLSHLGYMLEEAFLLFFRHEKAPLEGLGHVSPRYPGDFAFWASFNDVKRWLASRDFERFLRYVLTAYSHDEVTYAEGAEFCARLREELARRQAGDA